MLYLRRHEEGQIISREAKVHWFCARGSYQTQTWSAFGDKFRRLKSIRVLSRLGNRTRNPKTNFNAEISVLGFSVFRFLRKSEKRT